MRKLNARNISVILFNNNATQGCLSKKYSIRKLLHEIYCTLYSTAILTLRCTHVYVQPIYHKPIICMNVKYHIAIARHMYCASVLPEMVMAGLLNNHTNNDNLA